MDKRKKHCASHFGIGYHEAGSSVSSQYLPGVYICLCETRAYSANIFCKCTHAKLVCFLLHPEHPKLGVGNRLLGGGGQS